MTTRDNELSRPGLIERRARKLLEKFDVHRGQLPQDLIDAFTGLRKALDVPVETPVPETKPAAGV